MTHYYTSPRIKIVTDNRILRPNEQSEAKARKSGTAKRVSASMGRRFLRRLYAETAQDRR